MINTMLISAGVLSNDNDSISLITDESEMLKITQEGFYVRGVKVPQDEREAESVYKTFHQWLTWATLNRNR
jgi:hypothetical protein